MSRFWKAGSSDEYSYSEESSSDSESGSASAAEFDGVNEAEKRFADNFFGDGDSSDEEKRVVVSYVEKTTRALYSRVGDVYDATDDGSWDNARVAYDALKKELEKSKRLLRSKRGMPRFVSRCLTKLQAKAKATARDKKLLRSLSPKDARALTRLAQQVPRNNETFSTELEKYRVHHGARAETSEFTEISDMDFESSETETDSEAEEQSNSNAMTVDMIRETIADTMNFTGKRRAKSSEVINQMLSFSKCAASTPALKAELMMMMVPILLEFNPKMASSASVSQWRNAFSHCWGVLALLKKDPTIVEDIQLGYDKNALIEEGVEVVDEEEAGVVSEDSEQGTLLDSAPKKERVYNSFVNLIARLDSSLYKALQNTKRNDQYLIRLRDLSTFLWFLEDARAFFKSVESLKEAAQVAALHVEHIYYKRHSFIISERQSGATETKKLSKRVSNVVVCPVMEETPEESAAVVVGLVKELVVEIIANGSERSQTRAVLCHVYSLALHDNYHAARDVLLASHLPTRISSVPDIRAQILYNRCMAQLGFSAFRAGLVREAQTCLSDLSGLNRAKELLAQGTANDRRGERSVSQIAADRRRQTPAHMFLPLEVIDTVHYFCGMVVDLPSCVLNHHPASGSKYFQRAYRTFLQWRETSSLSVPRDCIMASAYQLTSGNWRDAERMLMELPAWTLLNREDEGCDSVSTQVLEVVKRGIRVCALTTYLSKHCIHYKAASLHQLTSLFDLPHEEVSAAVCRMVAKDQVAGTLHQPTQTVMMHTAYPTPLQSQCLALSDAVSQLTNSNERAFDAKTGEASGGHHNRSRQGPGHFSRFSGGKKAPTGGRWKKGGGGGRPGRSSRPARK